MSKVGSYNTGENNIYIYIYSFKKCDKGFQYFYNP